MGFALTHSDSIYFMSMADCKSGRHFFCLPHIKVVKEFIEQGKIYIGVSAGSILMGPTIETANWGGADRNEAQIKDLNGLNFVPFLISPHYTKGDEELLKREISKWHYPVRFLTDAQAFLIQDDTITLVGKGAEIKL